MAQLKKSIHRTAKFGRAVYNMGRSRFWTGRPFFISHLITTRCFAHCPTCLWRGNSPEETDPNRIIDFYKKARQQGFVSTTIWGGEPLLRRDLFEITSAAKNAGIVTGLITNGHLLPRYTDKVASATDFIIVSLDFASCAHDDYRRVPGLFDNAIRGIRGVQQHNPDLKIMINSVVSQANVQEILPLVRLAERLSTTITFESVNYGSKQFDTGENVNLRLSQNQERQVFQRIKALKQDHPCINNSDAYLNHFIRENSTFQCRAPFISLRVEPDGSVTNCRNRKRPLGNAYYDPLDKILNSRKLRHLQRQAAGCQACVDSGVIESSLFWDGDRRVIKNSMRWFR